MLRHSLNNFALNNQMLFKMASVVIDGGYHFFFLEKIQSGFLTNQL
jgi:hypothetical protein